MNYASEQDHHYLPARRANLKSLITTTPEEVNLQAKFFFQIT